jgi:DNA-directed RNA polymerase specialized sigma24 family protein
VGASKEEAMRESERRPCRANPCLGSSCSETRCRVEARRLRTTATADARAALASFCEASWPTVRAAVLAHGYRGADAEDLTQAYFARFLERGDLEYAASWKGSLSGFLRVSVRHFLSNERDRARAVKRGGGQRPLSLDAPPDDPQAVREPACHDTPETQLVQRQAEATIQTALAELRHEMADAGSLERLARVEEYLLSEVNTGSYRRMAEEWGVGESAARVTVHRLRRRLVRLLRRALTATLPSLGAPRWA